MKMSMRYRRSISGFTLIELLTVILIIGILMGLILGVAAYAQRRNLETRAKSDIETLCTALANYKMDIGEYPSEAGWIDTLKDPDGDNDFSDGFLAADFENLDPWGTPYFYAYEYGEDPPSQTFVLLSLGEDGEGLPGDSEETLADNLEAGKY